MPTCKVSEGVQIYYKTYGQGDIKVLLIMGFAATHEGWDPQIKKLESISIEDNGENSLLSSKGIQVCAFDNRGVGKSSIPISKFDYSTKIMAKDALALMDHLKWDKAHVFGHSLGSMIAAKLGALAPERVSSLALLSGTGGGYQCLPRLNWVLLSIAFRFLKAKTPQERALVDLDTHYTQEYLSALVGETTRRKLLYEEYVKNISASGMQSNHGQRGQLHACWTHTMTSEDYNTIRKSSILVSVIHGKGDVIAQIEHGRTIAKNLHPVARMVELSGGHLITHQNTEEVNEELIELMKAAESNVHYSEWTRGYTIPGVKELPKVTEDLVDEKRDSRSCSALLQLCLRYAKLTSSWTRLTSSSRKEKD